MADHPLDRLLRTAADRRGNRPLEWVATPILGAQPVVDLWCRTGPLAAAVPPGRWVGVDPAARPVPGRPVVRGTETALPLRTDSAGAVAILLALPLMTDLNGMFAEVRRVLRPAGTVVALVPSHTLRSPADWQLARLLRPVRTGWWPNRSALDGVGWLFAAADFAVLTDDRVPFALPLPDPGSARRAVRDLVLAGLWPPGLAPATQETISTALAARSGPGRVLPVPMRRVVARR